MRRLPFLSNADRRALLVLEWVLMFIVLGFFVYTWVEPGEGAVDGKHVGKHGEKEVRRASRTARGKTRTYIYSTEETPVETFPFDPNTADSTQLLRLGLAPWQVRAIYRYRAKRGRYHTPEDFARLPGMTNEVWTRLSPMIRIAERFQYIDSEAVAASARERGRSCSSGNGEDRRPDSQHSASSGAVVGDVVPVAPRDTVLYPEKYKSLVQVDLNEADTNQLKKIPGIASYRARQIVRYRESLGGFVSVEQVMESCTLPDDVLDWFCLTHTHTRKVNINRASVQAMRRHPYISFYQARAIYEHRRDKGEFRSLGELLQLEEFVQKDIDRLQPYVEL